ncbi:MAG: hypothetical protein ABSF82_02855 [Candidatus Bathyarchaeia archaeon]
MESDQERKKAVLADLNRWHLLLSGYSEAELVGLGDLAVLGKERVRGLIRRKAEEAVLRANPVIVIGKRKRKAPRKSVHRKKKVNRGRGR